MATLRIDNIKAIKGPRMAERRALFAAREKVARDRERGRAPEREHAEDRAGQKAVLVNDCWPQKKKDAVSAAFQRIAQHFAECTANPFLRPDVIEITGDLLAAGDMPARVSKMLGCAGICWHSITIEAGGRDRPLNQKGGTFWIMREMPVENHRVWCREEPLCKERAKSLASLGVSSAIMKCNVEAFLKARAAHFISLLDSQVALHPDFDTFLIGGIDRFDGNDLIAEINKILADNEIFYKASVYKLGVSDSITFELL